LLAPPDLKLIKINIRKKSATLQAASTIIMASIFIKTGLLLTQLAIFLIKKVMTSLEATMTTTTDISSLQEHRILKKSNENSLKIRNTTSNKKKLKLRNHPKIHLINVQYKLASNTRKVTFANTPPDLI
jgi:hypothetical protein